MNAEPVIFLTFDARTIPDAVMRDLEGRPIGLLVELEGEGRFVLPLVRDGSVHD